MCTLAKNYGRQVQVRTESNLTMKTASGNKQETVVLPT